MKIIIRHKNQEYTIYGVETVEPMVTNKNGLFFCFEEKVNGLWMACLKNARIVSVTTSQLDWTYTEESTLRLLGL